MKKKTRIAVACVVAAAAAVTAGVIIHNVSGGSDSGSENTAYVEKISVLTDTGSVGMTNRYAGVIEAQDTWSVSLNPDSTVKEIFVEQGQEVSVGDDLFSYDTEKYESDLSQANIDMQRLQNELTTIEETITQLETDKKKASSADQANYTIQIQEQNLNKQQKELDIQSKQLDIDKLNDNIAHATVQSEMDGVVQTINNSTSSDYSSANSAFITIMKTGDVRVKGTINEQNIGSIMEGENVIVHSRKDNTTWTGTVTKIDTENKESSQNSSYYYSSSGSDTTSSSYPFYVTLDTSDGLMIGQHVYMEVDYGQSTASDSDALYLPEYYIDLTDPENPFVWADDGNGKLEKRAVTLGEENDFYEYEILDGLTEDDSIAFPDDFLEEGMKTAPMADMPDDYYETMYGDSETDYTEDGVEYSEDSLEEYTDGTDGYTEESTDGYEDDAAITGTEDGSDGYTGEDASDTAVIGGGDGEVG